MGQGSGGEDCGSLGECLGTRQVLGRGYGLKQGTCPEHRMLFTPHLSQPSKPHPLAVRPLGKLQVTAATSSQSHKLPCLRVIQELSPRP